MNDRGPDPGERAVARPQSATADCGRPKAGEVACRGGPHSGGGPTPVNRRPEPISRAEPHGYDARLVSEVPNVKAVFELAGEARANLGRTDSRRLRKAGKVPAVMYGGGEAPESVILDHNSLSHQMEREAFYTSILTLKLGTKSQQVVVKDVQRHPARPIIMHLDFQL